MKKILLIDHPQFTSATYFLWQGLKEIEAAYPDSLSVSCYPYIPTNYDEDAAEIIGLPWFQWLSSLVEQSRESAGVLPSGIPAFQKNEYLTTNNETLMYRGSKWRAFGKHGVIPDESAAVTALSEGKFDLVILGNSHRVPTILLARLKERVGNFPPVVYLDAGERDELNEHWVHVFRPDLTFKQILTPEVEERGLSVKIPGYRFKMYPLPLSSPSVDQADASVEGLSIQWLRRNSMTSPKMIPVFYWLGSTWPARDAVLRALNELVVQRDLPRVKGCTYLDYNIVLAKSWMGVTMRGSGRDTNHYWEIPLYRTTMISDGTMGCIHPYPFEHGKTALFYRSVDELVRIVEDHLADDGPPAAELHRIALDGMDHLKRYHSTAARAVFFLDILNRELGFLDPNLQERLQSWKADRGWEDRPWEGPVV